MTDHDQHLIHRCTLILQEALPASTHRQIPKLAAHLIHPTADATQRLITPLLDCDVTPGQLLCATMHCHPIIIQEQLNTIFELPRAEQPGALKAIIEHFGAISTAIVEIGDQQWQSKLDHATAALQQEHELRILSLTIQMWLKTERIKLVNYYRGLPVQAVTRVIAVEDHLDHPTRPSVTAAISREVARVLAINDNRSVLALDHDGEHFLRLEQRSITKDNVTFQLQPGLLKKRNHFRLEPIHPIDITLQHNKKSIGTARILDFSIKHIDLQLPADPALSLARNDMLDFYLELHEQTIHGRGCLRHQRSHHDHRYLCLELIPSRHLQHHLQQEIANLQRKIIQEIKEKFTMAG